MKKIIDDQYLIATYIWSQHHMDLVTISHAYDHNIVLNYENEMQILHLSFAVCCMVLLRCHQTKSCISPGGGVLMDTKMVEIVVVGVLRRWIRDIKLLI